jgi:hypothetical protein
MEEQDKPTPRPVLVLPAPPAPKDPKPISVLQKDELVEYTESVLVSNARRILPTAFNSLKRRLKKDDPKAFEQAAQTYGLIKATGGVAVNILTQNNNYSNEAGAGFEKIVRQLEKRDRPENDSDENIIDAEVEEVE